VLYRQPDLASWPTTLAGLLPSWPVALGHDAVARAHDASRPAAVVARGARA
jgi:hypothetical protein